MHHDRCACDGGMMARDIDGKYRCGTSCIEDEVSASTSQAPAHKHRMTQLYIAGHSCTLLVKIASTFSRWSMTT